MATCSTWNGGTADMCPALWFKQHKALPFHFSVHCKHLPQLVWKKMGSFRGEEEWGGWGTPNPGMKIIYGFRGLLQSTYELAAGLFQGSLNIGFSLTVEVRNTGLAALPTCVTIFYNLALYNVVFAIKDLKGWAWIYLFIYLFEFHLVSSLQVPLMLVTFPYISCFINCVEKCYI